MRQVYNRIPVYTGDVSGVCSALYELGGMVVMHDPSGCNSTYNTHDEIRWYDRDSLIFLSGLDETDAVLGSDEKLIRDIEEAAAIYYPAFIAIANSPIPYITGLDFDAVCRVIEQDTGIPAFYIMTNGMHDYVRGAGMAFLELARRFVKSSFVKTDAEKRSVGGDGNSAAEKRSAGGDGNPVTEEKSAGGDGNPAEEKQSAGVKSSPVGEKPVLCNILGMTPLDFAAPTSTESLCRKIHDAGMDIVSCWAMRGAQEEDSISLLREIQNSASADVNLVVSSAGLPAAAYMRQTFGIPYTVGIPAEGVEDVFFDAVREAVLTGENRFPFRDRKALSGTGRYALTGSDSSPFFRRISNPLSGKTSGPLSGQRREILSGRKKVPGAGKSQASPEVYLIGEPVIMTSLAASVERTAGARTRVLAATESNALFTGPADTVVSGEEELAEVLRRAVEFSFRQTGNLSCRQLKDASAGQTEDLSCRQAVDSAPGHTENVSSGLAADICGGSRGPVYVIADPCYAGVLPAGSRLIPLPHLAFSGRIFLRDMKDLFSYSFLHDRSLFCGTDHEVLQDAGESDICGNTCCKEKKKEKNEFK